MDTLQQPVTTSGTQTPDAVTEERKPIILHVRIKADLMRRLRMYAAARELRQTAAINEVLNQFLPEYELKEGRA